MVGVRGTVFWGKVDADGTSTFAALEHQVSVSAAGSTVLLKPGEKTTVSPGQPPLNAVDSGIAKDYVDTFAIDGNTQKLKERL